MTFDSPSPESSDLTDAELPSFEHPPVDEVALSLQFPPLPGFSIPFFGLFWAEIRDEFPHFEVHPPLPNFIEEMGANIRFIPNGGLMMVQEPDVRCWFLKDARTELFQVQRDRFVSNWRKITGSEEYPRYPTIRKQFAANYERFCEFLIEQKMPMPFVTQCEVTYVNHIEYGKGWQNYDELGKVLRPMSDARTKGRFLPEVERMTMQMSYRLSDGSGRLHVALQPVLRARDGEEVLQLTLTARGAPATTGKEDVLAWLDLGRKWVVNGFADFTTDEIQETWRRQ